MAPSDLLSPPTRDRALRVTQWIDLAGTGVFAIEGALVAAGAHLDWLGVAVLALVTAVGGGVLRDVLLGAVPPATMRSARYVGIALAGAVAVIAIRSWVQLVPAWMMIGLDAIGLGLFAVAGAEKALTHEVHPSVAVILGGVSGVGGGVMRDVLIGQVPALLTSEIYGVAALFGAAIVVLGQRLRFQPELTTFVGASACFALRVVAVWRGWSLPLAG